MRLGRSTTRRFILETKTRIGLIATRGVFIDASIVPLASAASATLLNPHHGPKEAHVRDQRPNLNAGTLGAAQHGKTTLTSAITRALAGSHRVPFKDMDDFHRSPSERNTRSSQMAMNFEWWTDKWRVAHSDLPGNAKLLKIALAPLSLLDVVVLVIRADEGVTPQTLMLYHAAKHLSVPVIVPFINVGPGVDAECVELVQMELSESLTDEELDACVIGDALASQTGSDLTYVKNLIDVVESRARLRNRDEDAPFLMHVEQSGVIPTRGVFSAGRVAQGRAEQGDKLRAFVGGLTCDVVFKNCEIFKRTTPDLRAGDRGGAFLKRSNKYVELKRGAVIYHPSLEEDGSIRASRSWKVKVRLLSSQPGNDFAVPVSGAGFLFHRSNAESVVFAPQVVRSDREEIVEIGLSQEILGRYGDAVVLRWNDVVLFGTLVVG